MPLRYFAHLCPKFYVSKKVRNVAYIFYSSSIYVDFVLQDTQLSQRDRVRYSFRHK